jgi:ABC-2 type transport system ATP-binding protein
MQKKFYDLLKDENKRGTTIFFSSHVLSEVQKLCKKVAIIKEGEIIKIENIDTLRKKHFKKLRIVFNGNSEGSEIKMDGIIDLKKNENEYNILYSGKIKEVLKYLSDKDIEDIAIEEPSLEEIFMHYYVDNKEGTN